MPTVKDAAKFLDVSARQVYQWAADGSIRCYRYGPKLIRFDMADLEKFAKKMRQVGSLPMLIKLDDMNSLLEIKSQSTKPYFGPGIYFLFLDDELVYIGQSVNVFRRIGTHCGDKQFNSYSVVNCEISQLNELEAKYIRRFLPPLNIAHKPVETNEESMNGEEI